MIKERDLPGFHILSGSIHRAFYLILILSIGVMYTLNSPSYTPLEIDPVGEVTASGEEVFIELSLNYDSISSGRLDFYMGTGPRRALDEVNQPRLDVQVSSNKNLNRLYEGLLDKGESDRSLFRSVLDTDKNLDIDNFTLYVLEDRGYLALAFTSHFEFETDNFRLEYEPLSFLYRIRTETVDSIESLQSRLREEDEIRDISIQMDVALDRGLSLQKRSDGLGHWRTPLREEFSMRTNMFIFTKESNDLSVSHHFLLSPIGVLISTLSIILMSGLILAISWKRYGFIGYGWALPILAGMISIFMLVMFFLPWISIYSLGGGTVLIPGIFLLITAGATHFFHPRTTIKGYEEESEYPERIRIPRVIYVDRPVYIRVNTGEGDRKIDPYEVLEVSRGAEMKEIEKAYRIKALEYHPDKYENSPERIHLAAMKEMENVNRAYEYFKNREGV